MSKSVNELSLEQCLQLDRAAHWYGSNATHGKPDVPVIYAFYPDHGGLHEYIGQAHVMKSSADINELYLLQEVRDAIPGKLESVLKKMVKTGLIQKQSIEELRKCVKDEMSKYINTPTYSCINNPIHWQIHINEDKQIIKFNDLSELHGNITAEAPEPEFQVGNLVLFLSQTGKESPFTVIGRYTVKKKTKYRIKAVDSHKERSVTTREIRLMSTEEQQHCTRQKQHSRLDLTEF